MTTQLTAEPISVSAKCFGTHLSGGAPVSGLSVGSVRTHDAGVKWNDIETSAGAYSWATLDAIITTARTAGCDVLFTVYGTPTFYASVPDQGFVDKYGVAGGAGYPALDPGLSGLSAFIATLVTRYNAPSGAWRIANPTLGKGIAEIETWNEPEFTGVRQGYWWGTAAQMIDVCRAVYLAAKAGDSSIIVLSPGSNVPSQFELWVQASSGSVRARDTYDYLNIHTYSVWGYGNNYAAMNKDPVFGEYGLFQSAKIAAQNSSQAGIYITEMGFATSSTPALTSLLSEPASVRYTVLARCLMLAAGYGAKKVILYTPGNLAGNFSTDTNGVVKAFNDVATALAGKTITYAEAQIGSTVTVRLSDGTSFSI